MMAFRTRRKWAPDVIRLCTAFAGTCRVCHLPIEQGSKVWRFTWSEERGQAHADCGFWNLEDEEQVRAARELLALTPQSPVPRELLDFARKHSIVTKRADGEVSPTAIGFALMKLIRGAR